MYKVEIRYKNGFHEVIYTLQQVEKRIITAPTDLIMLLTLVPKDFNVGVFSYKTFDTSLDGTYLFSVSETLRITTTKLNKWIEYKDYLVPGQYVLNQIKDQLDAE